jgi:hypothetical protein
VIGKVADRVGQFDPIGLVFKVQIDRRPFFSDFQGKRRFTDLSRPQQNNRRRMREQVIKACAEASW